MVWHYHCPKCSRELMVEWELHEAELSCPHCRTVHYPPVPSQDHFAYFGGDHWPREFEEAALNLRGVTCDVPGCYQPYQVLTLRKPTFQGGRVSVDNIIPMCNFHTRLKGEQDYDQWVRGLSPEERSGPRPEFEIVFTEEKPESPASGSTPVRSAPLLRSRPPRIYPVYGRARLLDGLPQNLHLVTAQPVPAGAWRRLVLDYRCMLQHSGTCRVIIAVWPVAQRPDWSPGLEKSGVLFAAASHEGEDCSCHESRLELDLGGASGPGLWTAAVFLGNSGGRPELTDYLLSGED